MFAGDLFDESGTVLNDPYLAAVTEQLIQFYSEEALNVPGITDSEVFSVRLGLMSQVEFNEDGYFL